MGVRGVVCGSGRGGAGSGVGLGEGPPTLDKELFNIERLAVVAVVAFRGGGGRDRGDAAAAEAQLEEGGEAGAEAAGGGVLAVHPGLEVRDPRQVLVPRQRLPAPLAGGARNQHGSTGSSVKIFISRPRQALAPRKSVPAPSPVPCFRRRPALPLSLLFRGSGGG